jgi:hypothetical protein
LGTGAKYLQVEVDTNNSGTYVDMGTSQLIASLMLYSQAVLLRVEQVLHVQPVLQEATGTTGVGITGAIGPTGAGAVPTGPQVRPAQQLIPD